MRDSDTPLNTFLTKLLSATGLKRRGRSYSPAATIQRALRDAGLVPARRTRSATAARASAAEAEVVDVIEPAPADGGRFAESSFTAEAGTRAFKLFEPTGHAGPRPLLVMLHGCTQGPDDFAAGTRMNELAQAQGLFVLYPAQAPRSNAHKCWNWFQPEDQRRGQGEPALLAGMTRHVMATHRIDPDRVFVAGLSAGGAMAAILASRYPDLFAAAGVHSGLPAGAAHDVVSAFSAMKSGVRSAGSSEAEGQGSAPVIVFHGDADTTVNALNGSHVIEATLGRAAANASREASAAIAGRQRAVTRTVYRPAGASPGTPSRAEHWLIHGGGHGWAGGAAEGSFTEREGPDASREMLRFFAEHPLRSSAAA